MIHPDYIEGLRNMLPVYYEVQNTGAVIYGEDFAIVDWVDTEFVAEIAANLKLIPIYTLNK